MARTRGWFGGQSSQLDQLELCIQKPTARGMQDVNTDLDIGRVKLHGTEFHEKIEGHFCAGVPKRLQGEEV